MRFDEIGQRRVAVLKEGLRIELDLARGCREAAGHAVCVRFGVLAVAACIAGAVLLHGSALIIAPTVVMLVLCAGVVIVTPMIACVALPLVISWSLKVLPAASVALLAVGASCVMVLPSADTVSV